MDEHNIVVRCHQRSRRAGERDGRGDVEGAHVSTNQSEGVSARDPDEELLQLAVKELTAALGNAKRQVDTLRVIDQAKGIIMASTGCDADGAFKELVKQTQYTNTKLREVAESIVADVRRRNNV
jgi:hypothetical protein